MTQKSLKYIKPTASTFGTIPAAEGFCSPGGTATGSTCSNGPVDTNTCGTGGLAANPNPGPQLCNPGGTAANCLNGGTAGG